MADVKVCDRCGVKLTEEERSKFSLRAVKPSRCVLTVHLFKRSRYSWLQDDFVKTEHDLCMDCTNKLAEWLEIGETEDKK